jgi:WS/DGAT C-terminal domain
VPLVGNETLNIGVLSYAGQLNMTAVADGDACSDVDVFAHGVRNAFEKLARPVVTTTRLSTSLPRQDQLLRRPGTNRVSSAASTTPTVTAGR